MKHLIKNLFVILIIVSGTYLFYRYILPYIVPFVIAGVLTVFIEPLVRLLQSKAKLSRAPAVIISLILIIGLTGTLLTLFVARLVAELIEFSSSLPMYTEMLAKNIVHLRATAESFYFSLPASLLEFIANNMGTIEKNIGAYLTQLQAFTKEMLNQFIILVSSVPGILVIIFVSLIATFFMAKDRRVIIGFWLHIMPEPWGSKTIQVLKDVSAALFGYARAQLILISITFFNSLIGLAIIDAPYILLMAAMIGVFDLIPVLGPGTVYIPWIIWEIINNNVVFAVKLGVVYIIIVIIRQVLEAKVVANAMGLHPLATLISIYVGLQIFGPLGLVLGPLFLIGLKALAKAGIVDWPSG
ncbi:sporulation integral membrane protein YtvI [Thermincola ferriacetica]